MKEITNKWLSFADSDYHSSCYLFDGARYPQAIYLACQAIEKLLKAVQIELSDKQPYKIHRLENLAKNSNLNFSDEQYNILTDLSKVYGTIRYPDIAQTNYNTKLKTEPIIKKAKAIYLWTLKQFKHQ